MAIIDKALFNERIEDFRLYYSTGFLDFQDFWRSVDWNEVRLYEREPGRIWKDGVTIGNDPEVGEAKRRLLKTELTLHVANSPIDYFEFGVRSGGSMSVALKANTSPYSRFYGFDTFEGLPDGWVPMHGNRGIMQKRYEPGAMAVERLPIFSDPRVSLVKGLFQDTLHGVIDRIRDPGEREAKRTASGLGTGFGGDRRTVVNVDCDTYTGALFAITTLHQFIKMGDLVYFDEFSDILNEFMAFNDYIRSFYMRPRFKLIARGYDGFLFQLI